MPSVNVVLLKEPKNVKLKKPVVVAGFPSPGLVGSVSAVHLTQQEDFQLIGYIWGENFAPVVAIHDYSIMPPVRIMASEKKNMIVVLSEISIPFSAAAKVAEAVVNIAKMFKAREIAVISSISEPSKAPYYSTNSADIERKLKLSIKSIKMKEGAISGVGPLVIIKAREARLPAYILLVPSLVEGADAAASSKALKYLAKIYDMEIDTSELDEEAKQQAKVSDAEEEAGFGTGPSMYR